MIDAPSELGRWLLAVCLTAAGPAVYMFAREWRRYRAGRNGGSSRRR